MSDDDVHPDEMNTPHDFDDAAGEALLAGWARAAEPELSQLMDDMRTAFTSTPPVVGAELSALMAGSPAAAQTPSARRFERMRSSIIAKIAAGAAAAMAATGGLAVAGALPAPVQHALSNVGIGSDSHHATHATEVNDEETSTTLAGDTTTTEPGDNEGSTPTSVETGGDNHGGEVSGVAHDGGDGCEHGASVSAVASDGRSHNDGSQCVTTSTTPGDTTPTTVEDGNHGRGHDGEGDNGDGGDDTPPTTVAGGTTPTTEHHGDGGGHHGGSDGGGDNSGDSTSGGSGGGD